MSLAAVAYERGFHIDDFMAAVSGRLHAQGFRLCGVVQENVGSDDCATMILVDLASTQRFGISQALGACARGCRLDPHGLIEASARLEQAIGPDVDLIVLNKFGKEEAEEGGGLRGVIARALDIGVPVLIAVRPPYDEAWNEFHGGFSATLPAELESVASWCVKAIAAWRAGCASAAAEAAP